VAGSGEMGMNIYWSQYCKEAKLSSQVVTLQQAAYSDLLLISRLFYVQFRFLCFRLQLKFFSGFKCHEEF
jgi:hypothetical protein